ncbi:MAG: aminotransferase class IV [Maricaulaceae bacterium]|nr:aminotransferase class IV [Maricaulaceae bacterium]
MSAMRVWTGSGFAPLTGGVDPMDRGFLIGDGVFETLRLQNGALRRAEAHFKRLKSACAAFGLPAPDQATVQKTAAEMAAEAGLARAIIRLTVSRGPGPRGLDPVADPKQFILLSAAAAPEPPRSVKLHPSAIRREPSSLTARFKTLSYADNAAARREAKAAGADMALLLTGAGQVSGADAANLFWIADGALFTPSPDCAVLPGTTRAAVIALARARGVTVHEGAFAPDAMMTAQAVFITNAALGVVAVSALGGRAFDPDAILLAALRDAEEAGR